MAKKGRKHYSTQEKVDAVLVLKSNGHNFSHTAKQLGIYTHTLKSWYNRWGYKIDQELEGNPDVKRAVQEYADHKNEFIKELSEVKQKAIEVIKQAIDTLANNPDLMTPYFFQQLNNTIKLIHDIEMDREPKTNGEQNQDDLKAARWQKVKKQIVNHTYIQNNNYNDKNE